MFEWKDKVARVSEVSRDGRRGRDGVSKLQFMLCKIKILVKTHSRLPRKICQDEIKKKERFSVEASFS